MQCARCTCVNVATYLQLVGVLEWKLYGLLPLMQVKTWNIILHSFGLQFLCSCILDANGGTCNRGFHHLFHCNVNSNLTWRTLALRHIDCIIKLNTASSSLSMGSARAQLRNAICIFKMQIFGLLHSHTNWIFLPKAKYEIKLILIIITIFFFFPFQVSFVMSMSWSVQQLLLLLLLLMPRAEKESVKQKKISAKK